MSRSNSTAVRVRSAWQQRLGAMAIGLAATLVTAPGAAVTIPDLPLQTGTAYPPANIMFILDDSGSMDFDFMPGAYAVSELPAVSPVNIAPLAYPRNTLYYNPSTIYRPWLRADGTRYGNSSYTSAASDPSLLTSPVDLSASTRTFYVPRLRDGLTDMANTASYYRFQILAGGTQMQRSEYGGGVVTGTDFPGFPTLGLAGALNSWTYYTINVPSDAIDFTVATSGGTRVGNRGADLYVRYGSNPTTDDYECRSRNNSNSETCTISGGAVQAGNWVIGVRADSVYAAVRVDATYRTSNRCDRGTGTGNTWINCTLTTPDVAPVPPSTTWTNRSVADELANYANWYAYHRTRMKVAKAGVSEAFDQVGTDLRVGYDSIWNRQRGSTSGSVSTSATPAYPIPVGTDGGLFRSTNRTEWFDYLHRALGDNGTPLHGALQRTGRYYESAASTGPWGPGGAADQLSCRQNFAILTTDGYWNSGAGFTAIGDTDGTVGTRIDPKSPIDANDFYRYNPERPYQDNFGGSTSGSNTLADVAMHYWKRDLRTLANDVPSSTANPAFWQHMTTFGVSIGLQGRLNPKVDLPSLVNGTKNWGNPMDAEDEDRIDDLWHAAVNGRGEFVSAANPREFTQGLVNALATVAARLGSASNVTANSTSFQTETRVYQASYVSGKWSGELSAFEVSSAGVSQVDNDGDGLPDPAWKASAQMPTTRNILTWGGTTGTAFPTASQRSQLARTTGLAPIDAANNEAYLKGTRTLEKSRGGTLRDRDSLLGDIVNSSPIYSPDSKAIFVGANDGMLHAFTTVDIAAGPAAGTELFAYVPKGIDFTALSSLSDPQYVHRWFVDGPIAVSSRVQTPGVNYLVGALGRGGRGVYGLNVTNPASFGNSSVLWDQTGSSLGANMGHVLGEPLIVTLNDAASTKAVIVSNGINSPNGSAVLFVINLATGAVIREIDTNATGDNGLSAPRGADVNTDGKVDYIYAGDRLGNLWKFDLSTPVTATWGVANSGSPMFIAQDGSGTRQPITAGLGIAKEPITGKIWIVFGSGSLMTAGDISSRTVQTMYGVVDDGLVRRPADLEERQITIATTFAGKAVRAFESHSTLPAGRKGWFVDLDTPPNTGERIISAPRVSGRVMVTSSIIPPATNTCEAGGSGYVNAIDVFTGTSVHEVFFDANGNRNYSDDTVVVGGVTLPIGSIDLGIGMPTMPTMIDDLLVVGGSNGRLGSVGINPQGGAPRREAWHEIVRN